MTPLLQAIGFFGGFTMFDVTLSMLRELGVRVHANPRCIGSMLWTQGPCSGHRVHAVHVRSTLTLGSMLTLNPMQRGSRSHACYMSRRPATAAHASGRHERPLAGADCCCHVVASILLSFVVIQKWHYVTAWYVFAFFR